MINDRLECFLCGRSGALHRHHCLHGSRRKAADKYDLTVYLCPECHQRLHDRVSAIGISSSSRRSISRTDLDTRSTWRCSARTTFEGREAVVLRSARLRVLRKL